MKDERKPQSTKANFKASTRWEKSTLRESWERLYTMVLTQEHGWLNEEAHFESLCVGWCLASGLSLDDALDFYQGMIALRLF